ncbi:MAG: c-type cytochrome [Acidobacteriota bacterium]|nr:c-type cytochrome [Acidobacteriota bacterium]|tara:strand:- start:57 stop:485 length:429 start_codon:yes stop_codon:yes gene_type:complete
MVRLITQVTAFSIGIFVVPGLTSDLLAQERSISDGVYTTEQAARGKREYTQQCATCHSTNLRGGEMAPGLVGQTFISGWSGETLWTFADFTNATMPQDAPGNLSAQRLNDVIAFILSSNDYPAGDAELSLDLESEGDPIMID